MVYEEEARFLVAKYGTAAASPGNTPGTFSTSWFTIPVLDMLLFFLLLVIIALIFLALRDYAQREPQAI